MAVITRENLLERINSLAGENSESDTVLSLIEDVDDTFKNFENNDNVNWKDKYEKNDKEWRERYKARFLNDVDDKELEDKEDETPKTLRFEDLFKED